VQVRGEIRGKPLLWTPKRPVRREKTGRGRKRKGKKEARRKQNPFARHFGNNTRGEGDVDE